MALQRPLSSPFDAQLSRALPVGTVSCAFVQRERCACACSRFKGAVTPAWMSPASAELGGSYSAAAATASAARRRQVWHRALLMLPAVDHGPPKPGARCACCTDASGDGLSAGVQENSGGGVGWLACTSSSCQRLPAKAAGRVHGTTTTHGTACARGVWTVNRA